MEDTFGTGPAEYPEAADVVAEAQHTEGFCDSIRMLEFVVAGCFDVGESRTPACLLGNVAADDSHKAVVHKPTQVMDREGSVEVAADLAT